MEARILIVTKSPAENFSLQVFNMVRKEDWYKPDVYLYREMIDTLGKNKLIEV